MPGIHSLLVAIVQPQDVERATRALVAAGLKVTLISSMGGFLREGNVTLLLGLARPEVSLAIQVLSEQCRQRMVYLNAEPYVPAAGSTHFITPVEVQVGGATVFVVPVEQFVRIDAQHRTYTYEPTERRKITMERKLILAVVPEEISNGILDALMDAHYGATLISTTGGLLRKGNATLMIGVEAAKTEDAIQQIERLCADTLPKMNITHPSVNIFVVDVERFESIGLEPVGRIKPSSAPTASATT
ncbi:MAG: cyclic-di-AMP receptor [Chloroflexi bacterium]|nr:cyclic-di-AMP receptor [Chloroflexota bacterium]